MLKKFVGAAIVMILVGSVALAETVTGLITKASDKEITVQKYKAGEKGKKGKGEPDGDPIKIKVTSATKIGKRVGFKKDTEPETVAADDFVKLVTKAADAEKGPKGVFAKIEVEDGKATSITFNTFGGKGKGKKKEKE